MLVCVSIQGAAIRGGEADIYPPVQSPDYDVVGYGHLARDVQVLVDWLVGALGEEGSWDQFKWSVGPWFGRCHF